MYSFDPTEEQQMLVNVARRYAENDLRAAAREAEEIGELPTELVQKGWELGVLPSAIPGEYGGFGERSAVMNVLAAEELGWGDLAGALAVMTPALFALPLVVAGSETQKKEYLPKIAKGEWAAYSAALVEYDYDFDPNDLRTTARAEKGGYLLNGEKRYVSFADKAAAMVVYANLDGKTQGFILPKGAEGLTVGERERLMGINALPLYSLHLDGVRVPKENRLGGADGHDFEPVLDGMRVGLAALAVGLARASFEYSRDYAKEREVLGSKIAQKQAIAFFLAEMATEIEAIRLLTWEAAWQIDQGMPEAHKTAYLAAQGAADMAMMVTDRGVQILGGHGYLRDHPVELWMRNGRGIAAMLGLAMV